MRPVPLVLLLLVLGFSYAHAQQATTTDGKYVVATVEPATGLVTIRTYPGGNAPVLSYPQHSFLYVMIGDRIFTNNNVGTNISSDPRYGGFLSNGVNVKIADTIRTTWANHNGTDIIQEVFPVRLTNSAQIVIRWKVKNNSNTPVWGQAQYLLDVHPGDPTPNDGYPVLTRYGYRPIWEQYTTSDQHGIPWLYTVIEGTFPNYPIFNYGTISQGYTQDGNVKLDLMRPIRMSIGDWGSPLGAALIDNLWGTSPNAPWGAGFVDPAILFQWDGLGVLPGKTSEIARTAYGTAEGGGCFSFPLQAFNFFPAHFHWKGTKFFPDTGIVDFYAWDVHSPIPSDPNYGPPSSNVRVKLEVGPQLRIVSPDTGRSQDFKEQTQLMGPAAGYIPQRGVGTASWKIAADRKGGCKGSITSWIKFTAQTSDGEKFVGADSCVQEIIIDCDNPDIAPPVVSSIVNTSPPYATTFNVSDNGLSDAGLDVINWKPQIGTNPDDFKIEVTPALTSCSKATHVVKVTQLDSTKAGCLDFTFIDCSGNETKKALCFITHSGASNLDAFPPVIKVVESFPGDTTPCRNYCDSISITELRVNDRGLDTIIITSATNMKASQTAFPDSAKEVGLMICVIDSTKDGSLTLGARDVTSRWVERTFCYKALGAGVEEVAAADIIDLIGNPASTHTLLRLRLGESQTVTVRVLDMTGRTVRTLAPERLEAGTTEIDIVTADLAAGTYYIVAEWNGRQYAKKLQVVK